MGSSSFNYESYVDVQLISKRFRSYDENLDESYVWIRELEESARSLKEAIEKNLFICIPKTPSQIKAKRTRALKKRRSSSFSSYLPGKTNVHKKQNKKKPKGQGRLYLDEENDDDNNWVEVQPAIDEVNNLIFDDFPKNNIDNTSKKDEITYFDVENDLLECRKTRKQKTDVVRRSARNKNATSKLSDQDSLENQRLTDLVDFEEPVKLRTRKSKKPFSLHTENSYEVDDDNFESEVGNYQSSKSQVNDPIMITSTICMEDDCKPFSLTTIPSSLVHSAEPVILKSKRSSKLKERKMIVCEKEYIEETGCAPVNVASLACNVEPIVLDNKKSAMQLNVQHKKSIEIVYEQENLNLSAKLNEGLKNSEELIKEIIDISHVTDCNAVPVILTSKRSNYQTNEIVCEPESLDIFANINEKRNNMEEFKESFISNRCDTNSMSSFHSPEAVVLKSKKSRTYSKLHQKQTDEIVYDQEIPGLLSANMDDNLTNVDESKRIDICRISATMASVMSLTGNAEPVVLKNKRSTKLSTLHQDEIDEVVYEQNNPDLTVNINKNLKNVGELVEDDDARQDIDEIIDRRKNSSVQQSAARKNKNDKELKKSFESIIETTVKEGHVKEKTNLKSKNISKEVISNLKENICDLSMSSRNSVAVVKMVEKNNLNEIIVELDHSKRSSFKMAEKPQHEESQVNKELVEPCIKKNLKEIRYKPFIPMQNVNSNHSDIVDKKKLEECSRKSVASFDEVQNKVEDILDNQSDIFKQSTSDDHCDRDKIQISEKPFIKEVDKCIDNEQNMLASVTCDAYKCKPLVKKKHSVQSKKKKQHKSNSKKKFSFSNAEEINKFGVGSFSYGSTSYPSFNNIQELLMLQQKEIWENLQKCVKSNNFQPSIQSFKPDIQFSQINNPPTFTSFGIKQSNAVESSESNCFLAAVKTGFEKIECLNSEPEKIIDLEKGEIALEESSSSKVELAPKSNQPVNSEKEHFRDGGGDCLVYRDSGIASIRTSLKSNRITDQSYKMDFVDVKEPIQSQTVPTSSCTSSVGESFYSCSDTPGGNKLNSPDVFKSENSGNHTPLVSSLSSTRLNNDIIKIDSSCVENVTSFDATFVPSFVQTAQIFESNRTTGEVRMKEKTPIINVTSSVIKGRPKLFEPLTSSPTTFIFSSTSVYSSSYSIPKVSLPPFLATPTEEAPVVQLSPISSFSTIQTQNSPKKHSQFLFSKDSAIKNVKTSPKSMSTKFYDRVFYNSSTPSHTKGSANSLVVKVAEDSTKVPQAKFAVVKSSLHPSASSVAKKLVDDVFSEVVNEESRRNISSSPGKSPQNKKYNLLEKGAERQGSPVRSLLSSLKKFLPAKKSPSPSPSPRDKKFIWPSSPATPWRKTSSTRNEDDSSESGSIVRRGRMFPDIVICDSPDVAALSSPKLKFFNLSKKKVSNLNICKTPVKGTKEVLKDYSVVNILETNQSESRRKSKPRVNLLWSKNKRKSSNFRKLSSEIGKLAVAPLNKEKLFSKLNEDLDDMAKVYEKNVGDFSDSLENIVNTNLSVISSTSKKIGKSFNSKPSPIQPTVAGVKNVFEKVVMVSNSPHTKHAHSNLIAANTNWLDATFNVDEIKKHDDVCEQVLESSSNSTSESNVCSSASSSSPKMGRQVKRTSDALGFDELSGRAVKYMRMSKEDMIREPEFYFEKFQAFAESDNAVPDKKKLDHISSGSLVRLQDQNRPLLAAQSPASQQQAGSTGRSALLKSSSTASIKLQKDAVNGQELDAFLKKYGRVEQKIKQKPETSSPSKTVSRTTTIKNRLKQFFQPGTAEKKQTPMAERVPTQFVSSQVKNYENKTSIKKPASFRSAFSKCRTNSKISKKESGSDLSDGSQSTGSHCLRIKPVISHSKLPSSNFINKKTPVPSRAISTEDLNRQKVFEKKQKIEDAEKKKVEEKLKKADEAKKRREERQAQAEQRRKEQEAKAKEAATQKLDEKFKASARLLQEKEKEEKEKQKLRERKMADAEHRRKQEEEARRQIFMLQEKEREKQEEAMRIQKENEARDKAQKMAEIRKMEEIKRLEENKEQRVRPEKVKHQPELIKKKEIEVLQTIEEDLMTKEIRRKMQEHNQKVASGCIKKVHSVNDLHKRQKAGNFENYDISDIKYGDKSDDEDSPKNPVPVWARGSLLNEAIHRQHLNPPDLDLIFDLQFSLDLPQIFSRIKPRFIKRTSSANWDSAPISHNHDLYW